MATRPAPSPWRGASATGLPERASPSGRWEPPEVLERASVSPDPARLKRDLADLVAIDSQNQPGREIEAALFLRDRLAGDGLDVSVGEFAPGRATTAVMCGRR